MQGATKEQLLEEKADMADFSQLLNGKAVTYYRKEIALDPEMLQKGSLLVCFKGSIIKLIFSGTAPIWGP